MARHNFREKVLMFLAVVVGVGILLLLGSRLMHVMASSIPPGNGGVVFAVSGISAKLFATLMVLIIAAVVGLALVLWKR